MAGPDAKDGVERETALVCRLHLRKADAAEFASRKCEYGTGCRNAP
jgi:hypothetical protein